VEKCIGNRTRMILLASSIIIFTLMVIFIFGLYNYINSALTSPVLSSLQPFIEALAILAIMFGIAYWAVRPEKGQKSEPPKSK